MKTMLPLPLDLQLEVSSKSSYYVLHAFPLCDPESSQFEIFNCERVRQKIFEEQEMG